VFVANGIEIICHGGLGNDVSQIREREAVAPSDFMTTFWGVFWMWSIDTDNGR